MMLLWLRFKVMIYLNDPIRSSLFKSQPLYAPAYMTRTSFLVSLSIPNSVIHDLRNNDLSFLFQSISSYNPYLQCFESICLHRCVGCSSTSPSGRIAGSSIVKGISARRRPAGGRFLGRTILRGKTLRWKTFDVRK